jgi:hypothetical protein
MLEDFTNIKLVNQPSDLKVKLYPHQLATIYKMEDFENSNIIYDGNCIIDTKIGVNANITGYGKTLEMIGLIVRDKMEWDLETPFVFERIDVLSKNRIKKSYISRFEKLPTTLVLLTPNIVGQWVEELKNTSLKYDIIIKKKDIENVKVQDFDIILTIPSVYNMLISNYSNYAWKRFIFDEPGHSKVPSMKEIYANFYWLVTATPDSITSLHRKCEGSFMKELLNYRWTDFETQFSNVIIRHNPEFIKASFNMPKTFHYYHECYQLLYNAIKNFVNPKIKTMIEAGNISGAIICLGGEITDNIFDVIKRKKQEELLEIETKIQIYTLRNYEEGISEWVDKKIKIINQINDIENKFKNILNEPCPICLEKLDKPLLEPNCQNIFCGSCIFKWIEKKNNCPLCRNVVDTSKLVYIKENKLENKLEHKLEISKKMLSKPEKIIDIINSNHDGRFLLFSDEQESFTFISKILSDYNILFVEIKGHIKTIEKNLEYFRSGKIKVLFLNSNTSAAGINLQETTDIILYHKMSINNENQIIGRANRIGRVKDLNVHHLT